MGVSLFRQSLVIHAEQMEHGGVEIVYTHSIRFGFVAEVTRPPMPWKMPGLAVEEVDLLTSAPTFQTRSYRRPFSPNSFNAACSPANPPTR